MKEISHQPQQTDRSSRKQLFPIRSVTTLIIISGLFLFLCSSVRHALFQSTAFDLGIFDNAVYLISQGEKPFISFRNLHIFGDHAAWIFYPLALLYKIYPDVHWLFAVQAVALALGALPTWYLALQAELKQSQAIAMAVVYLLYPLIFNVNLFDFHPETIALPAILWAVLAARLGNLGQFCWAIVLILSCKAVLSLTIVAMGFWLLLWEKKRLYGIIALVSGVTWFIVATQFIIPTFSGGEAAAVGRYDFLGNSVTEIAFNLLLKPKLILGQIFTLVNLEYLLLLFSPVIWGLSFKHLAPLIPAVPSLFLNLLTDYQLQKDLIHQYSLPILPFLLLAVIANLAAGGGWLRSKRNIIIWAILAFLALAKFGYFGSKYLKSIDTWPATSQAIAKIQGKGGVLTSAQIAPHLTHRQILHLAIEGSESIKLSQFDYVLLNQRHPGWGSSPEIVNILIERLKKAPEFELTYQQDSVFLFEKR